MEEGGAPVIAKPSQAHLVAIASGGGGALAGFGAGLANTDGRAFGQKTVAEGEKYDLTFICNGPHGVQLGACDQDRAAVAPLKRTLYGAIESVVNASASKASVDHHRRALLTAAVVGPGLIANTGPGAQSSERESKAMELLVDHVMFPVYYNNAFIEVVEAEWRTQSVGKVYSQPQNPVFKGTYFESKSFYVEYLSTVKSEPYWSNAVYVVVSKKYWPHYKNPALATEHFLVPSFGCGYTLVSPDFPYLNSVIAKGQTYDGLTLLISKALEQELLKVAGQSWVLPPTGKVRVHEKLVHVHDIAVIDEKSKLVAPLLQPNPLLREFL